MSPHAPIDVSCQARLFDEPQLASLCLENIDKNTADAITAEGFTDIDLGKGPGAQVWDSQQGLGRRVWGSTVGALGLGVPWGSCTGELGSHHLQWVRSSGPAQPQGSLGPWPGGHRPDLTIPADGDRLVLRWPMVLTLLLNSCCQSYSSLSLWLKATTA